jgi:hypothetical protein
MALVVKQEEVALGFQPKEDMKKRASTLGDIAALFLCDAWRLGKDHGVLDE